MSTWNKINYIFAIISSQPKQIIIVASNFEAIFIIIFHRAIFSSFTILRFIYLLHKWPSGDTKHLKIRCCTYVEQCHKYSIQMKFDNFTAKIQSDNFS